MEENSSVSDTEGTGLVGKKELVSTIPFLWDGASGNEGARANHPPDPGSLEGASGPPFPVTCSFAWRQAAPVGKAVSWVRL